MHRKRDQRSCTACQRCLHGLLSASNNTSLCNEMLLRHRPFTFKRNTILKEGQSLPQWFKIPRSPCALQYYFHTASGWTAVWFRIITNFTAISVNELLICFWYALIVPSSMGKFSSSLFYWSILCSVEVLNFLFAELPPSSRAIRGVYTIHGLHLNRFSSPSSLVCGSVPLSASSMVPGSLWGLSLWERKGNSFTLWTVGEKSLD